MSRRVPLCLKVYPAEDQELREKAAAAGLSLVDFIISRAAASGAWRANRVRGPVTPQTVAEEAAALSLYWNGNPASGDRWSAVDSILADLGPTFANIDFRASCISELGLNRPDIPPVAFSMSKAGEDPTLLVRNAFIDWFDEEPEAALDAFSIDDTCKFLLAEYLGWPTVVAAHQTTQQLIANCYGESERAGVSGRRAHTRRILNQWRERGIPWPEIEIDRHGAPRLVDNVRIEFSPENGRLAPRLVSSSTPAESDNRRSTPDPVTGQRAPVTPYASSRVGASPGEAMTRAFLQRVGGKIAGE